MKGDKMIDLDLKPQRPTLVKGYDNELYALFRASPSNELQNQRSTIPLNISLVIDRSGSMGGRPIYEAIRSAEYVISRLRATDTISVVAYDSYASVIVPAQKCEDKNSIIAALREINVRGATDLHSGWLLGAEQVAINQSETSLNRVMLLSDGNANKGEISTDIISTRCGQLAEQGIITSTYGLGYGFNEDLMIKMARAGLGQTYYGETADDLLDPFQEEFSLLINTVAWNLKLKAQSPRYVELQLMNKLKAVSDSSDNWHLPDLAEGGDAWALFKLKVDDQQIQGPKVEVLRCNFSYDTKINGELVTKLEGPLVLSLDRVSPEAFSAVAEDEEVKKRIQEVLFANLQDRARQASLIGDWFTVEEILLEGKVIAANDEWLQKSIQDLEKFAHKRKSAEFAKSAGYSSDKLHRRLSSRSEIGDASYDYNTEMDKEAYLRRKISRGKKM